MTPLEDCVRCGGTLGSVLTGACIQFPAAMSMLLAAGLLRLRRDEKQGLVFTSDRFRLRAFQRVAYAAAAAEVAAAGAELWRAAAGGAACDRAASTAAALGASLRAAAWLGVAHATNFERNWACAVAFATLELVVAGALLLAPPVESFKALQLGCGAARFAACVASVAAAAWLYFGRDDADRDAGRDDALRESLIGEPGVQPRDRAYSIDGANPLLLLESGGRRLGPSGLIERCARGRSDATPADGLPGDDAADAPPGAPPAGRAYAGATFPSKNLVGPAQPKTAVVACRAENGALVYDLLVSRADGRGVLVRRRRAQLERCAALLRQQPPPQTSGVDALPGRPRAEAPEALAAHARLVEAHLSRLVRSRATGAVDDSLQFRLAAALLDDDETKGDDHDDDRDDDHSRPAFKGGLAATPRGRPASAARPSPGLESSGLEPPRSESPAAAQTGSGVAAPLLVPGRFEATVAAVAVATAQNLGDSMRETFGNLASGRILYRIDVCPLAADGGGAARPWRCVKTFAQLRALVTHVRQLAQREAAAGLPPVPPGAAHAAAPRREWPPRLNRPRMPADHPGAAQSSWHQPPAGAGQQLQWTFDCEAVAEAADVLGALLRPPQPSRASRAVELFLETDVCAVGPPDGPTGGGTAVDLVVVDRRCALRWEACTLAADEERRRRCLEVLLRDSQSNTLNNALDDADGEADRDVGDIAYEAARLLAAILGALGVPREARVSGANEAEYFERIDAEPEARALCCGDGRAMRAAARGRNVYGEAPRRTWFAACSESQTAIRGAVRRASLRKKTTSMPPLLGFVQPLEPHMRGAAARLTALHTVTDDAGAPAGGAPPLAPPRQFGQSAAARGGDDAAWGRPPPAAETTVVFSDGTSGGTWVALARQRHVVLHTSAWRDFSALVAQLRRARPLRERASDVATRAARAATLVNLHGCLAVHTILADGAGSGRPQSTKRCRDAGRYVLCAAPASGAAPGAVAASGVARSLTADGDHGLAVGAPSVHSLTLGALEAALLRHRLDPADHAALARARLLPAGDAAAWGGARGLEATAALCLCSGRASGAPLAALPPRPRDAAVQGLRRAARDVVDASLDFVAGEPDLAPAAAHRPAAHGPAHAASHAPALSHHGSTPSPARGSLCEDDGDGASSRGDDSFADCFDVPFGRYRGEGADSDGESRTSCERVPGAPRQSLTVVLPHDFERHAHVVARRAWRATKVARGKKRRERRERLSLARPGGDLDADLTGAHRGGSEWGAAALTQRRREESAAPLSESESDACGALAQLTTTSSDDEAPSTAFSGADSAQMRSAATRNLLDFLAAAGGRATQNALRRPRKSTRVRFGPPDFRPALRLLPDAAQGDA